MNYDYETKTLFITFQDLIELLRTSHLENPYQTESEEILRIRVV
jgi:hypothetical protein